jgi:hypothetical protein
MNNNNIRDCARGLVIINNPASPAYKIDVTAREIILQDAHGVSAAFGSTAVTLDITLNGANGLDAGSEAPNQWYYVWLIAPLGGPIAGLLSLSSETPSLPSGYSFKAFAGAIGNFDNGGNDFSPIHQEGRTVARNAVAVLNSGTAGTPTAIDCSTAIPQKAVKAIGDFTLNLGPGGGRGEGWLRSGLNHGVVGFAGYLNTQDYLTTPFNLPVIEPQTLYYNRNPGSSTQSITVCISGFEF